VGMLHFWFHFWFLIFVRILLVLFDLWSSSGCRDVGSEFNSVFWCELCPLGCFGRICIWVGTSQCAVW